MFIIEIVQYEWKKAVPKTVFEELNEKIDQSKS
jgi:hypothetical protein